MAFPRVNDDTLLFRRARGFCLQPVGVTRAGAGSSGYRLIAICRTGAEGPGMIVQLGKTRDPNFKTNWKGGQVSGFISHAPDSRPLIATLFDKTTKPLMLVADTPAPGLSPNGAPDLSAVPNNHLAYAVQWFLFAAIAAVIYLLALRRRQKLGEPRCAISVPGGTQPFSISRRRRWRGLPPMAGCICPKLGRPCRVRKSRDWRGFPMPKRRQRCSPRSPPAR